MDQGFPVLNYVDVRRFIQFGVIKGLLYRIHKYATSSQYLSLLARGQSSRDDEGDALQKYTDGCHCFDQITVEKNMGDVQIMEQLRNFPKGDVEIIYR
jgi:nitrogen permease regulator 2-like protein